MDNRVVDYTFTIIEDGQVPLAGEFTSASYTPVVLVVIAVSLLVLAAVYAIWVSGHARRVTDLAAGKPVPMNFFMHPLQLLRREEELEYELTEVVTKDFLRGK